ncbi:MAG: hypothetical protein KF764_00800 [Labilithrix sp.]|nr:hypothetical protein [Labilithrix sp.]
MRPSLWWFTAAGVIGGVACLGEDPDPAQASSIQDGGFDAPEDAGVDDVVQRSCSHRDRFTSSMLVPNVNTKESDGLASLTADETAIFLTRSKTGDAGTRVFTASRASRQNAFDVPRPVEELTGGAGDLHPWITGDGKTLFFARALDGGVYKIHQASRSTPDATFGPASEVPGVNSDEYDSLSPSVSDDLGEMIFSSNRNGGYRIYRSASFQQPVEVTELSGLMGGGRGFRGTVLHASGLYLYFGLSETPTLSSGYRQVWVAERESREEPFRNARPADEINIDGASLPVWISPDLCRLYVSQDRADGGVGSTDIWMYSRSP